MKRKILDNVTVEITNRCQLRCRACGIWNERDRHELSPARFKGMMEALLMRFEIRSVSVTGGEPFLHPKFGAILRYLATLRLKGRIRSFGIYTNGALPECLLKLCQTRKTVVAGMNFGISIDGNEETHDRLRGKGAYQKSLRTLDALAETYGETIDLEVKFTLNRFNYRGLLSVYRLARAHRARFSPKLMEPDVGTYYHRSIVPGAVSLAKLTKPMVKEVRRQVLAILKEVGPGCAGGIDAGMFRAFLQLLQTGFSRITRCLTPERCLFITSRGDVHPCLYMPSAGRLSLKGDIPQEVWRRRQQDIRKARRADCPRCFAYHGFLKPFNLRFLA